MKKSAYTSMWLAVTLGLSVLLVYQLKLTLPLIWPTNNSLFFRGDWAQHYLSWEMFRALPWQLPLGTLTNYFYPVTTNIGYTDAIPLLAFAFKLVSPVLPGDFQYIGLWFLSCFLLQAFFAVLLLRVLNIKQPIALWAGAMFFVLSPVLLFRIGHPALCAQWLILACLWLYFRDNTTTLGRAIMYQLLVLVLSAFIHPYLTIMVLGFAVIFFLRLWLGDRIIGVMSCLVFLLGAFGLVLLSWYVIGYFALPAENAWQTGGGFSAYASNLLGFINPFEYSIFLPGLPLQFDGQREGFAYLGMGMCVLLVLIPIKKLFERSTHRHQPPARRKEWRKFIPLFIWGIGCAIFSLSNIINLGEETLWTYTLPTRLMHITDTFRAAGRFIWVLYYVIFAFVFYTLSRLKLSSRVLVGVLLCTLSLQIIDLSPLIQSKHISAEQYQSKLGPTWDSLLENKTLLVMYPPFRQDYLEEGDYVRFVYLAHRHNLAITTGYLARYDSKVYAQYLTDIQTELHEGGPDPTALYITTPEHAGEFEYWLSKKWVQKMTLDGYIVLRP